MCKNRGSSVYAEQGEGASVPTGVESYGIFVYFRRIQTACPSTRNSPGLIKGANENVSSPSRTPYLFLIGRHDTFHGRPLDKRRGHRGMVLVTRLSTPCVKEMATP